MWRKETQMRDFKTKWKTWISRAKSIMKGNAFLCDSCKLNYGNVCTRPERPNALQCPEYKKK